MATKGVSYVAVTLGVLLVAVITLLVFSGFARSAFMQEKSILNRQISETEQIPCTKSPIVNLPELVYLEIPKNANLGSASTSTAVRIKANFSAKISTSCFEKLGIEWEFGDGQKANATCEYNIVERTYGRLLESKKFTTESCTTANHTYTIRSPSDLFKAFNVKINVFGLRSGFFSLADMEALVPDPNFVVKATKPDANSILSTAGACVDVNSVLVRSTAGAMPRLSAGSFEILDNSKARIAEDFVNQGNGKYELVYRSPKEQLKKHNVDIRAINSGIASKPVSLNYSSVGGKAKPELLLFGNPGDLDFVTYTNTYRMESGVNFPDLKKDNQNVNVWQDIAVGDLNNDGEDEIIVIAGKDEEYGDLFVFNYRDFRNDAAFRNVSKPSALAQYFAYADVPNKNWSAITVANNIETPDGNRLEKAIIALGNPGELYAYSLVGGGISEEYKGNAFPDLTNFVDLTAVDMDGDEEDEIIVLQRVSGDLFFFKYKNLADVNNNLNSPYFLPLETHEWVAITSGDLDGNKETIEIVALSNNPGELYLFQSDKRHSRLESPIFLIDGTRNNFGDCREQQCPFGDKFPDASSSNWKDVAAADMDGDGIDELVTLRTGPNAADNQICWFDVNENTMKQWDDNINNMQQWAHCSQIRTANWAAIAAGDVSCRLTDFR